MLNYLNKYSNIVINFYSHIAEIALDFHDYIKYIK
jgi:hypothetical protein